MAGRRTTIAVAGATGFIGRALCAQLAAGGHHLKALTRYPERYLGPGDAVYGEAADEGALRAALRGARVAYYLLHSLDQGDFAEKEAHAATNFARAAAAAGVRRIVFLGALGDDRAHLSAHLQSRHRVEGLLGQGGVPVTVLRAAIVVGNGGVSWQITRRLAELLPPVMPVPLWARTRTQPIALSDAIRYLAAMATLPAAKVAGKTFEIGGADVLTYMEMIQQAAEELGKGRRLLLAVPFPVPELAVPPVALLTGVGCRLTNNLLGSMSTEVVVGDDAIRELVAGDPLSYRQAVRQAIAS